MFNANKEPPPSTYLSELLSKRDEKALKEYDAWVKRHNAKLRRLQRELQGVQVPGDYDGGYDE